MNRNPSKIFLFSEGNPQFIDMKINENRYSQDSNICDCVWTTDGYVCVAFTAACLAWRKHTCVSFFVIARCKMFCIDVTLLITMSSLVTMITESVFAVMILSAKNKKKISFVLIAPKESVPWFRRSWIACYLLSGTSSTLLSGLPFQTVIIVDIKDDIYSWVSLSIRLNAWYYYIIGIVVKCCWHIWRFWVYQGCSVYYQCICNWLTAWHIYIILQNISQLRYKPEIQCIVLR